MIEAFICDAARTPVARPWSLCLGSRRQVSRTSRQIAEFV